MMFILFVFAFDYVQANGQYVVLYFDSKKIKRSFFAQFIENEVCGREINVTMDSQSIQSVGFAEGAYPANISCTWILKGPEMFTIIATFKEFKVSLLDNILLNC